MLARTKTRGSGPPTFLRYFGSVFAQQSRTNAEGSALWVQTHVTTGATATSTRLASLRTCSAGGTACVALNTRSEAIFPGYATLVPPNPALYAVVDSNVTYGGTTVPRYSLVYLDNFLTTTGGPADVSASRTDVWFQWMGRDHARGYMGFGVNPAAGLRRVVFGADPQAIGHLIAPDVNHDFPGEIGMRESFDAGNTWIARPDLTGLVKGALFAFDVDTREKPNSVPTGEYWPLVSAISFFPDNAELVLLGTMSNGLFFSNDRGFSWRRVVGSEQIPNVDDIYWKSANAVIVASAGRGLWELQLGLHAPLERLGPLCRDCRVLPVIPIPTDRLAANAVTDATAGFDSALVALDGRLQDVTLSPNGVASVALGPGTTWLTFSDSQFEPGFPISEQSKPGSFDGLPRVAALVQEGFVIRGLTFARGRLHGILYGLSDLPLPPAPFVPLTKNRGRKMLDLDGPYLTLFATELRGSSIPPVTTLTVRGQNFKPNKGPVVVAIQGRVVSQAVPVDKDGSFALSIRLNLPAGQYDLLVTQGASTKNPVQAAIGFNVTHADDRGEEKQ